MGISKTKNLTIANPIAYIMFLISLIFQNRRFLINYCDILIPCLHYFNSKLVYLWKICLILSLSILFKNTELCVYHKCQLQIIPTPSQSVQFWTVYLYSIVNQLHNFVFSKQLHINISLLLWFSKFIPVSVMIVESCWCLKCV